MGMSKNRPHYSRRELQAANPGGAAGKCSPREWNGEGKERVRVGWLGRVSKALWANGLLPRLTWSIQ